MNSTAKQKSQLKEIRRANVLEGLKDIGAQTADSFKNDLVKGTSDEFFRQLIGIPNAPKSYSGEIFQGETLEMREVMSEKTEENKKLREQITYERRLHEEEKILIERRGNELRLQLHAIMREVASITITTQNVGREIEIASMQATVNPGIYHLIFFEKLLEFLKSFRRKIEDASVWLSATNSRAQKKNYWTSYKKHGGSFLLSPDHYLQRSAG